MWPFNRKKKNKISNPQTMGAGVVSSPPVHDDCLANHLMLNTILSSSHDPSPSYDSSSHDSGSSSFDSGSSDSGSCDCSSGCD
jgi:hypothetical protein